MNTTTMTIKKIGMLAIASALALALNACDSNTEESNIAGTTNTNTNFRVVSVQGRLDITQAQGTKAVVSFRKHSVVPDANGAYMIADTVYRNAASARMLANDTGIADTVRIVIGKDTLREIPVNSWANILPTNYIVQRNISAVVDAKYADKTVEALWWNADSIAHVVTLGQGTNANSFSGYIYNVYDDSAYSVNAHLYFLLARIRSGSGLSDSVLAYTDVMDVKAKAGDLAYTSTQFLTDYVFYRLGYPKTPVDSSVAIFGSKMTYLADTFLIEGESVSGKIRNPNVGSLLIFDEKHELGTKFNWSKIVMNVGYATRTVEDTIKYVAITTTKVNGASSKLLDTVTVIRPVGSNGFSKTFAIVENLSAITLNTVNIYPTGFLTSLDSTITVKSYLVK